MNQAEYTPVPITLQPRSPYLALLDFCHFKANEMPERDEGEIREKKRGKTPTIDAKPRVSSPVRGNKARDARGSEAER